MLIHLLVVFDRDWVFIKHEGMKSPHAVWNALKKPNAPKILPELWAEFDVFSWADFIRKSSSSRGTWHDKPEFLRQSVPLSKGGWTWSSVTVLAAICSPELRGHKSDENSIALSINQDKYLNGIDKIQIKSCVGLCSLEFTTGVLRLIPWVCQGWAEVVSWTVQVSFYQLLLTGKDGANIHINMVNVI